MRSQNNSKTRKLSSHKAPQSSNLGHTQLIPKHGSQNVQPSKMKKVFTSKTSRNSSNIVNQKKIDEIKSKY